MRVNLTQIRYLHLGCYAQCLCYMCSLCGIPHRPTSPFAALVCHLATHCPKLWWWDLAWHALCEVSCILWLEWNRLVIRSGSYTASHVKNSLLMSAGVTLTVCVSGLAGCVSGSNTSMWIHKRGVMIKWYFYNPMGYIGWNKNSKK